MAIEKAWTKIGPKVLLVDGGVEGLINIDSTIGFHVKQQVILLNDPSDAIILEIKAVLSKTQMMVGLRTTPLGHPFNISAYLAGAQIYAEKQPRPKIPELEHERAVFAEEPIVAKRVINVDQLGDYYTYDNPFPVDPLNPQIPLVKNIIINSSNTIEEFILPANVKKLMVKLKRGSLSLAFQAAPTEFITHSLGAFYYIEGINYTGSIFYKSTKDDDLLEIEAWT